MRRQLQYTTVVVLVLILGLISTMYLLNNYSLPMGSNSLTSAAVAVPSLDCSKPLPSYASAKQKAEYQKVCSEK
ncbi:hypothetical protein HZA99_01365 [Candidatus Woesearchaeota archaeon]|nr:hypothetical protein [Candidatus Woesearchaeota archaeon]